VREEQAALEQRARQLDAELRRQASATSASEQELARAREALAGVAGRAAGDQPADGGGRLLALVLPAAMRGAATVPSLTIPTGTTAVVVRLPLVSVDFPRYTVTLKKAQGDRVIWRSDRLRAPAPSEQNALPVTVRASLLEPGAYTLEVSGLSARGEAEPLDSYPFRVVR
jgi:hypothetical protein